MCISGLRLSWQPEVLSWQRASVSLSLSDSHLLQVQLLRSAGDEVTITVQFLRDAPSFLKLPLGKGPEREYYSYFLWWNPSQASVVHQCKPLNATWMKGSDREWLPPVGAIHLIDPEMNLYLTVDYGCSLSVVWDCILALDWVCSLSVDYGCSLTVVGNCSLSVVWDCSLAVDCDCSITAVWDCRLAVDYGCCLSVVWDCILAVDWVCSLFVDYSCSLTVVGNCRLSIVWDSSL